MLKMDAIVPVDSRASMQNPALRKHHADSGLTDVVKADVRLHTLEHEKVFVEAITSAIEPLEFHRKGEGGCTSTL